MNCQEVMELMQRQLDGDLNEEEIGVLMNHTRQCPDCAEMFERLKLLSEELTSLPKVVPSYSLVDAIMPELLRIDELAKTGEASGISAPEAVSSPTLPTHQADPGVQRRRKRWRSWGSLGGVLAAGIVAGIFMITYPPSFSSNDMTTDGKSGNASFSIAMDAREQLKTSDPGGDATGNYPGNESVSPEMASDQYGVETRSTTESFQEPSSGGGLKTTSKTDSVQQTGAACNDNNEDKAASEGGVNPVALEEHSNADRPVAGESNEWFTPSQSGQTGENENKELGFSGSIPSLAINESALSPDGQFFANIANHSVKVTNAETGELLMETSRKNGDYGQLIWSDDSATLSYEVKLEQGAIEKYVVTTKEWIEKKADR